MREVWKSIPGFETYEVSNLGRVRHLLNKRVRKLYTNDLGYKSVTLSVKGKLTTKSVHVLVALAFIQNPTNLPEVNHKDGVSGNNISSNLEWMTHLDNVRHACENGLRCPSEKHHSAKLTWAKVREIRSHYKPGNGPALAKEFGVSKNSISLIIRRRVWKE